MAIVPTNADEARQWLKKFHETSDSLDVARLPDVYTEDAILQYGNLPPIRGLDNLKAFFGSFFEKFELMRHDISSFDIVGNTLYQACTITYQVKHDPEHETLVLPAFGVFHIVPLGDAVGKIREAEVYIDPSPLMTALARANPSD